jgi:hypothetical protein
MQNYHWLLSRLDAFIRKFYLNQMLRGGLILLICLLLFILPVSIGEYFLYLPVWARLALVAIFILAATGALVFWIIRPLSKLARMGRTLSHAEAAVLIGRHFPEISDKLLNLLQLKNDSNPQSSRELIEASIDQKASKIAVVPILRAVDFSRNKRFLPYLLPLVVIAIAILLVSPKVFTDAGTRLLQPTRHFEPPAPFSFIVTDSNRLQVSRNNDFTLNVSVSGRVLPAEIFVENSQERVPCVALGNHRFQYTFRNVTETQHFRLFAVGFYSKPFVLEVVPAPLLKAVRVQIDYPDYTGRPDEFRQALGDMRLPEGTRVGFALVADHADQAELQWAGGGTVALAPQVENVFGYVHRFMQDTSFTIRLRNKVSHSVPEFTYRVQVIVDQYPVIQVQEFRDTVNGRQILLNGTAGDDYGISKVLFHYQISDQQGHSLLDKSLPLQISGGSLVSFHQYFDVQVLNLQPGQKVSYFIEAWDNDGVHGPKAARSAVMSYQMYTPKQLDSSMDQNAKQINSGLSNSAQQSQQIRKDLDEMQDKLLQNPESNFEQQQNLRELAEKQEKLQAQLEATQKRLEEQRRQSAQKQFSEELRDKQDEVEKQLDNLLNNELKEQMKKLQELMAKLNREDAQKVMEQMQEQNQLFDMDMKRLQELMKQLEAQMRMEDLANKADQLAKDQQELRKQTETGAKDQNSLSKDQQELKNRLDKEINKELNDLKKLSKDMERSPELDQPSESGKEAGEKMDESSDELKSGNSGKSGQSQKSAEQNLKQMASNLRQQAGGMDIEQIDIDIRATRQLLTNLIRLSFDQENLMNQVRTTSPASQTYLLNQAEQARLYQASHMIRDSLYSLSKRIFKLAPTVNKETKELEKSLQQATSAIENRQVGEAITRQQFVMMHTNNLALMLNELLANLLQMQGMSTSGQGSQSKMPGGKKPKPGAGQQLSDIITGQQQLGNAMQQAQSKQSGQGKEGQQKDKPGQKGENGAGGNGNGQGSEGDQKPGESEQLARLAAQQAALRRQLQDLQSRLTGSGMGNSKELREIQQQMDRNETDLVNRRLTAEFMMRQQQIMTRLLEVEKSMREQEQDDKRSSNTGKEISRPMPAELQKYLQDQQKLLELYRQIPPQLKPYYKQMVDQYFKNIGTHP